MASSLLASHAVERGDPAVLRSILDEQINLAIWNRPLPFPATQDDLAGFDALQFTCDPADIGATLAIADLADLPFAEALHHDIAMLAARFGDIMGTNAVEVRLERVTTNACWKFHADYTTVRLITTYVGQATEWRDASAADATRQLATGAVGLFKGRELTPGTADRPPLASHCGNRRGKALACHRSGATGAGLNIGVAIPPTRLARQGERCGEQCGSEIVLCALAAGCAPERRG